MATFPSNVQDMTILLASVSRAESRTGGERVIEEGVHLLTYDLLDEHKAPELELEPIEILPRPSCVPLLGQPVNSVWLPAKMTSIDPSGFRQPG